MFFSKNNINETNDDLIDDDDSMNSDNLSENEIGDGEDQINIKLSNLKLEIPPVKKSSNESFKGSQDLNNCISNDLLKKLDNSSPVNSIRTFSEVSFTNNSNYFLNTNEKPSDIILDLTPKKNSAHIKQSLFSKEIHNDANNYNNQHSYSNNNIKHLNQNLMGTKFASPPKQIMNNNFNVSVCGKNCINNLNYLNNTKNTNNSSNTNISNNKSYSGILPSRSESSEVITYQHLKFNSIVNSNYCNSNSNNQNCQNNQPSHNQSSQPDQYDSPTKDVQISNFIKNQSPYCLFTPTKTSNCADTGSGSGSKNKTVEPFNVVFTGKKGWFCSACKNFNFESNYIF